MKTQTPNALAQSRPFHSCILLSALLVLFLTACASIPATDPQLLEAIRWYTGEAGRIDDVRAKALLEQAAADADSVSHMWVARSYSTGRMGYTAEYDIAQAIADTVINDIERLADMGHREAMFLMGTAYAEGLGKTIDEEAAVSWFRRAAEKGHVLAQHNLGDIYAAGHVLEQDDTMAVYWWRQAAEAGDAIPQFQLGVMYEMGRGVIASISEARHWYQQAAERGEPRALEALNRLND